MSTPRQRSTMTTWRIFRWPLLLALLSLLGLVGALVGNGWLDALSWICLGSLPPLMILLWRR